MPAKSKTKNKSIWRSDNAQHFQLVHRSQRDPLINDPDAGAHVLLSFDPANQSRAKGKTRADLEADASVIRDKYGKPIRNNIGEAANYGIYFDDTEYDYMQHLRPIKDDENVKRGGENVDETVDTILVSAGGAGANKGKGKGKESFALKDGGDDNNKQGASSGLNLPASVLPSQKEMPFSFTSHLAVEPSLQGFQPDMDPHLRQALEALDDEAFVDDDLDDDFFGEVVADGEWDGIVRDDDEWREQAPEGDEAIWADAATRAQKEMEQNGAENMSLEARVALFKKQQEMARNAKASASDDEDEEDEDRDQLASLRGGSRVAGSQTGTMYTAGGSAIGKKGRPGALARRAASTKAPSIGGGSTAWSMSSSAMFRNKGLSDLDDRFAQLGKKYGIREDFDPSLEALEDEDEEFVDSDGEEAGEVVTREDFEGIMDDFLAKYETKHGKLREALGGVDSTSVEKLTILRKALGQARINGREWAGKDADEGKGEGDLGEYEDYESPDEEIVDPIPRSHMREKWDAETILSTKTNLENHPRTISAKESVFGGSNASAFRPGSLAGGTGGSAVNRNTLGNGLAPSLTSYTSQRPSASAFLNDEERLPKIRINPRTGFPEIVGYSKPRGRGAHAKKASEQTPSLDEREEDEDEDDGRGPPSNASDSGSDTEDGEQDYDSDATEGGQLARHMSTIAVTAKRDRNESKEDRKARKEALKANKKERKERKMKTKQAFASEKKKQTKAEKGRKETEGGPSSSMRLL